MSEKNRWFLVALTAVLLYFGSAVPRELFIPDEIRYSEIAREMIVSGNWFRPQLVGVDYFEKPVLGHWLNAVSQLIFGERPFAVRFFPVLGTLLSALLIWRLARSSGNRKIELSAPLIFLSTGMVYAIGTFGVLDGVLSFLVLLTMSCFYFGWRSVSPGKRNLWLLGAGAASGLAFLDKGLLGFLLPVLAIVPFLLWRKEKKRIFTLPWLPLAAAVFTCLPAVWLIHRQAPDFWCQFLYVEHFQRALSGAGAGDNRSQPFWYFLPVLIGGLMPWTLFLAALIRKFRSERAWSCFRTDPLFQYSLCMAGAWFLFFSCSKGKLATYVLPIFPALSILLGYGFSLLKEKADFRGIDRVLQLLGSLVLTAASALFLIQLAGRFLPQFPEKLLLFPRHFSGSFLVLAMAVAALWCRMAAKEEKPERKLLYFLTALAFLVSAVPFSMPPRFAARVMPEKFISATFRRLPPEEGRLVAADKTLAAAVAWSLKTSDVYLFGRAGELKYGLKKLEAAGASRSLTGELLKKRLARGLPTTVFTRSRKRLGELPSPKECFRQGEFFMINYPSKKHLGEKP